MAEPTMEEVVERLATLERKVDELAAERAQTDWRSTVGLFDDDPAFMRQVIAEGAAIREAERRTAREEVSE